MTGPEPMTGPEHYAEADRLLAVVGRGDVELEIRPALLQRAQVHATLAAAAAAAHPAVVEWLGTEDSRDLGRNWARVTA